MPVRLEWAGRAGPSETGRRNETQGAVKAFARRSQSSCGRHRLGGMRRLQGSSIPARRVCRVRCASEFICRKKIAFGSMMTTDLTSVTVPARKAEFVVAETAGLLSDPSLGRE